MRRLIGYALAVALVFGTTPLMSAIPQVMNYQGILRDALGAPIADGSHEVTFRLYDSETDGTVLWEEAQTLTTKSGLFSTLLGSVNPVPENTFDGGTWLSTEVSGEEMSPRTKIASVGYAFRALDSDSASYAGRAGNADLLDGYDSGDLLYNYPAAPAATFRAFSYVTPSEVVVASPNGRIRQVTGIYVSAGGVGTTFVLKIDGVIAHSMFTGNSQDAFWTSNGGAPMEVGPASTISCLTSGNTGTIVVTGFEY